MTMMMIIIIIIINHIFQGICNYIPKGKHVSTVYHVAAVLSLQFVVRVMLFFIYFYVFIFSFLFLFFIIFTHKPYIFIVYY